jgi:hypothetical protein
MYKYYAALYKELEHPGILEPIPHDTEEPLYFLSEPVSLLTSSCLL